ncbi:uncharacterized protein N7498_004729 [Penicillium cinerascens]|uniref:Uncharacterized protein n=1 Tax=Penicillium cinerascens TaxID=70096 RepID=A0A9W9MM26_9EURO|nr:uncharacterized protein N7498_004729 [Penicillium cinerascens]KAJ5203850.1 hypothetical protein N7498_004729 [Penicillium cinerascens]
MPSTGSGVFAAHQSPSRTVRRHRADQLDRAFVISAETWMTHTTGLGVGSAASRHRALIGQKGAECQERDARRTWASSVDLSNAR